MFLQRAITTIKPIVRSIHTTPSTRDSLVDLRYLNIPQENDDFHTLKTDFEKEKKDNYNLKIRVDSIKTEVKDLRRIVERLNAIENNKQIFNGVKTQGKQPFLPHKPVHTF